MGQNAPYFKNNTFWCKIEPIWFFSKFGPKLAKLGHHFGQIWPKSDFWDRFQMIPHKDSQNLKFRSNTPNGSKIIQQNQFKIQIWLNVSFYFIAMTFFFIFGLSFGHIRGSPNIINLSEKLWISRGGSDLFDPYCMTIFIRLLKFYTSRVPQQ